MGTTKPQTAKIVASLHGADDFLPESGEMAAMIRAKDWSDTPLGPAGLWPQSLRTAVSLCLGSNFPINLIWGPQHTQIYNDGYRLCCGDAHPTALGQAYNVTWASAWPAIGKPFDRARGGETSFLENQRMFLTRNGYLEETFFTFSLSPIRDESGSIGGLFHPVTETTAVMLSERRTRLLRDLNSGISTAMDVARLIANTIDILAGFEFDLPFALIYELAPDNRHYRLAALHGVAPDTGISPAEISLDSVTPWPFAEVRHEPRILEIGGVRSRLLGAPCGPYEEAVDKAFILPITAPGADLPPMIVILGNSPRLPLNDAYRGFYELLSGSITAALGSVRARENERLRADALAAIDRAKTAFFSNVSHEFRTPLTLMLGPLEDVLDEADTIPASQRERLDMVHRNALRLLKLVNALLDFSRIEAGRMQAHFEATDLAALTADLASNFRDACKRAGLDLVVACSALSKPVYVDRDMWEKIVLNLLSNAFKFTHEGRIEVSLVQTATGMELTVRDTGIGVPAVELSRIFERFHRIEGQRGRTHEGTGIGLSLVRELVGLHGGEIAAESVEGQGTAMRITLQFGSAHLPFEQVARSPDLLSTATRSKAFVEEALRWLPEDGAAMAQQARSEDVSAIVSENRTRIVLADDNADMRDYVRRILQASGYEVQAVSDGAAALVAARNGPQPDLVLCDVMMPELDGFGLLRALRSDPYFEGLPVIMLSARAGEEARIDGLAAGADDYLVKPFSARELRARIDSAVRLGKQRREATARDRAVNMELERRVALRAAELLRANADLSTALLERAEALKALARSEAELRASFEGAAVGKTLVEPNTRRILRINRALADLLGYEPEELVGRNELELALPEERAADDAEFSQFLSGTAASYLRETRYIRRDGTPIWVRVSTALAQVADGSDYPILAVTTIEDIDARHKAEDDLLSANRHLERVVDERTDALLQRDVLLREVYHRVKNNLQIVDGLLMKQARDLDSPRARQSLLDLRGRVHALGLVHHQLMRSADLKTFDIEPFLRELSENILVGGASDNVSIGVDAFPLSVGLDFAIPLGMLVTELVSNSLKHAFPEGAGRISVSLRPEAEGVLVLTVSDDGQGQPAAAVGSSEMGIGTSIIKGLVTQIDGQMTVRTAPGTTTEIRTKMPVNA